MANTIIDLIRHGEPVGGRAIRGNSVDDPLSDLGWQQMRMAVADYSDWDVIMSSPLSRCLDFSTELATKLAVPIVIEQNLKEVGFGSWEGHTHDEIKQRNRDEYDNFYLNPVNNRPTGAESLVTFYARVVAVYNNIIKHHSGQNVLLVTHAGVIRALITHAIQAELTSLYRIKVLNAGVTRIIHSGESSILERHSFNFKNFIK